MRRNGKVMVMFATLSLTSATMSFGPALAAQLRPHRTYTVVIDKMRFGPLPSGLRVGDTIIWENHDLFRHTATARDGSFDIDLMPTKKGKLVLKQAGTVRFSCTYHPGMKGDSVVR